MEQIENFPVVAVGKSKNLTNNIYGDYLVLYRTVTPIESNSKQAYWLCQCQKCKKYFVKSAYVLTHGENICSCKYDLTGEKFGRWTVQYKTNKATKNRTPLWHCICECGNEKDVDAYTLRSGQSTSCGCYAKEISKKNGQLTRIDITGQRFGKLVALSPIYSGNKEKHTKWKCQCDCGNIVEIDLGNLRSGKTQSCGCTISKQEENIIKLLTNNNINFSYQYRFSDFLTKKFDFFIDNNYIIEYDGKQHFSYSGSGWDTEQNYDITHKNDLLKNKYCFEHNIPLIRIPYNTIYDLNDLKLETTRFLLTPENEQQYYENCD